MRIQARAMLLVATALGATCLAPAAFAQTATAEASADTADIVVTARKREERLVDVPAAVTAISPALISDGRLFDARDLLLQAPGTFLVENNAGTARDISIRGVGTPTLFAEAGVALYVDDIYSSGFISYPTQFYDLERVEVLRGPQGALYGRNAVGGAVNILSARPTGEVEGLFRGTYGRYNRFEVEGMANVPLSEAISLRLSGLVINQTDGEYTNATLDRTIDETASFSGRVALQIAPPASGFTLNVVYEHNDANTPGTSLYFPEAGETRDTIERDTHPTNRYVVNRLAVTAEYETEAAGTFTLVAGGRNYGLSGTEDTDLSTDLFPTPTLSSLGKQVTTRRNEVDSRMAELRWFAPSLGPVTLLAGVTYLDETATGDILTDLQGLSLAFTGGALPFTLGIANDQSLTSWAGFAEAGISIMDDLELSGSLRYTSDRKEVDFLFTPSPALFGFVGPSQSSQVRKTFTNWSPGATLAWTPGNLNLYAKVQTGFRAGGFNFNVANAANLPYESETSINYEIGAKASLMDGRAFVGLSAYILEQDDVLIALLDFTAPPGLQGYLANLGEARTPGIELEGAITPVEGITFGASVGWMDPKFTGGSFVNAFGQTVELDGLQLPNTREWSFSVNGSIRRPLGDTMHLLANAAYSSRSSGFQDVQNGFAIGRIELLNASAGIEFGQFDVQAYVQNALNKRYDIAFGGFRDGTSGVTRAPGATYGISGRFRF
jgi:iron complex outermembrane recepter protein